MRRLFLVAALVAVAPSARADVKPHPLFSSHMVLQRGVPIPVWGTAEPGEKVTIELFGSGYKDQGTATADADGKWKLTLSDKAPAGGPYEIKVSGETKQKSTNMKIADVLVGDVWLCSGQSNMEWRLNQLPKDDQGKKVAAAATNPMIRLFDVPNRPFPTPQSTFPVTDRSGKWLECKPETVINFSAVGYFFGRDIQKSQNVPVGLIAADWGGTPAEAWTSLSGLKAEPELAHYVKMIETVHNEPEKIQEQAKAALERHKAAVEKAKADGKTPPRAPNVPNKDGVHQHTPTALYNGLIAPLLPYPIKGAIWYQGESNATRAAEYRTLLPAMIADWRKQWGAEFPFLVVQLAPFQGSNSGVDYAELRDAQLYATKKLPKVGIAIITDVGDRTDIHPQQKEPVGARLALAARGIAYGEKVEYQGPTFKAMKADGDKAILSFDHADGGLVVKGDELAGFQVAGADKQFKPAKAKVVGDTIELTSGDVAAPVFVRYGWVNFATPTLNLFNKAGLPAVPFRTDDLPLTTLPKSK